MVGQRPHVGQPVTACARLAARARPLTRVAAWTGGVAIVGALVTGCGSGGGSAVTRLTEAADAQVITATGQAVAARPGLTLHVGDEIRTAADGAAVFATGGRRGYLGAQASYIVRGRGAGVLQRGAFVVDGRNGPALTVTSGPVTAHVGRSAVRVEHGFTVRVGVLAGRAVTVAGDPAAGPREMSVPALYQVVVAGRGLTKATPLTLTDDDAERLVVADLVGDDIQLTRTAAALDEGNEGRAIMRIANADFGATASPRRAVSETALPMAMARAVVGSATNRAALKLHYGQAMTLRAAGGSWAVVARLIGTNATATSRAIDALLVGVPGAGTVLAAAPGGSATAASDGSGTQAGSTGRTGSSSGGGNGGGNGGGGSGNQPPGGKSNPPGRSPSPPPGPVQQVIDGVLGVLPPVVPTPSTTTKSCVLGIVNC
jgi:uncharacterized membrane protein YgcG